MSPFVLLLCLAVPSQAGRPILLGVEYAPPGLGKPFAALGVPAAKPYPDAITWGSMQRRPGGPIDFSGMDRFVREYQEAGFRELILVLKAKCAWGSRDAARNFAPRPEHGRAFDAWVRAVVERYDADGSDDMPGLRRPVRYYELGSEWSTFEPTPVEDYLAMLARAAAAARSASRRVVFLHAAFLTTGVFRHRPPPAGYAAAFAAADRRIVEKSLADIRKILDQPRHFDAVNVHALGDPAEIEPIVAWLRWEMKQRGYRKPLIISDTAPAPLIAWGPATRATGPPRSLGLVLPPATEADRPRLARTFTALVEGDAEALAWTHAFVAADMIKKAVIAAEQGVELINLSFMEDLFPLKLKLAQAGAGTTAWGGMAEVKLNLLTQQRTVVALRPSFYAVARLQAHLRDYDAIERLRLPQTGVRAYRIRHGARLTWIAWLEPARLALPGDKVPALEVTLPLAGRRGTVEKMIDRAGVSTPETQVVPVRDGQLRLTLTPLPVFVRPDA